MSIISAAFEFIRNPIVQIVFIVANPILGYIGGYFAGMTRVMKKHNEESRKRVLKMIEERKNEPESQRTDCWYD